MLWLPGRGSIGVAFQAPPGSQASSRGEAKDSALLSSRDAGLLEPPERPQGSGGGGKPSCPSPSAGDLRELPGVPLRGEGSCGGSQLCLQLATGPEASLCPSLDLSFFQDLPLRLWVCDLVLRIPMIRRPPQASRPLCSICSWNLGEADVPTRPLGAYPGPGDVTGKLPASRQH